METLSVIWFLLVVVLLAVYIVLDGFDFGVGILSLFRKEDSEKRIYMNSIGPIWDGNEVWLIAGGGSIFAAFPLVYATAFSGFYLAIYLLLLALFMRAVSFEFRSKSESPVYRKIWDLCFGIGSLLPALLLGVAFGNIMRGLPLNENKVFTGSFFELLNPYSVLIGLLSLFALTMHGAIYLTHKTDGELKDTNEKIATKLWMVVVVLYLAATVATLFVSPFLFIGLTKNIIFWVLFIALLASFAMIPVSLKAKNNKNAFIFSSVMLASMFGISAVSLFPRLIPSVTNLDYSLTIMNTSSSTGTLTAMLIIALIGMPFVAVYTIWIYRIFKGKTVLTKESY